MADSSDASEDSEHYSSSCMFDSNDTNSFTESSFESSEPLKKDVSPNPSAYAPPLESYVVSIKNSNPLTQTATVPLRALEELLAIQKSFLALISPTSKSHASTSKGQLLGTTGNRNAIPIRFDKISPLFSKRPVHNSSSESDSNERKSFSSGKKKQNLLDELNACSSKAESSSSVERSNIGGWQRNETENQSTVISSVPSTSKSKNSASGQSVSFSKGRKAQLSDAKETGASVSKNPQLAGSCSSHMCKCESCTIYGNLMSSRNSITAADVRESMSNLSAPETSLPTQTHQHVSRTNPNAVRLVRSSTSTTSPPTQVSIQQSLPTEGNWKEDGNRMSVATWLNRRNSTEPNSNAQMPVVLEILTQPEILFRPLQTRQSAPRTPLAVEYFQGNRELHSGLSGRLPIQSLLNSELELPSPNQEVSVSSFYPGSKEDTIPTCEYAMHEDFSGSEQGLFSKAFLKSNKESLSESRDESVSKESLSESRNESVSKESLSESTDESVSKESLSESTDESVSKESLWESRDESVSKESLWESRDELVSKESSNENRGELVSEEHLSRESSEGQSLLEKSFQSRITPERKIENITSTIESSQHLLEMQTILRKILTEHLLKSNDTQWLEIIQPVSNHGEQPSLIERTIHDFVKYLETSPSSRPLSSHQCKATNDVIDELLTVVVSLTAETLAKSVMLQRQQSLDGVDHQVMSFYCSFKKLCRQFEQLWKQKIFNLDNTEKECRTCLVSIMSTLSNYLNLLKHAFWHLLCHLYKNVGSTAKKEIEAGMSEDEKDILKTED
ncbi:hypothetical protein CEXT_227971 [Caerostris extrusa]|uniref:Uncharacterized protein n=1 Tax=Caerostris extrusa TaxID=172846 RepID=A0AAV4NTS7_CAEEX|nr:hypothetical protein CEXT_227971 [Caerostris extrusa]